MKIALFGAAGFIGSNLAARLATSGEHELVLCDLNDDKLKFLFDGKPFRFERLDIGKDLDRLDQIVSEVDLVFNLVAHALPAMFVKQPLKTAQVALFDGVNVVEACARHSTRLIHFSTSEVYGKSGGRTGPMKEDETDLIMGPIQNQRWIYGSAKQMLDRIIYAHGVERGLNFTIVRPFNFIGPLLDSYQSAEHSCETSSEIPRVFAAFMSALVHGQPLQLVDGGLAKRCFTHIDDAVAALELVVNKADLFDRQIVNIGSPDNEISMAGLADMMMEIYKRDFDYASDPTAVAVSAEQFYGPGYEDCDRRIPDISKLHNAGWVPQLDLEATVRNSMVFWFENRERLLEM
jgi:UDP-apiose/xylose synthase